MALSTQQKRLHFQNSKKLLENNSWENCIRSYNNINYPDNDVANFFQFYPNKKFFFKTKDWLDGSCILYKNITLSQSLDLEENFQEDCSDFNKFHLIRNKKKCLIVIGNELFADFNTSNIEKRLQKCFAGQCAKNLDTDLYSCHVDNIDNTSNSLFVGKILTYLEQYNYEKIYLIFQISDPVRCLTSLWWNPIVIALRKKNSILKNHLSYHFFPYEDMVDFYKKENSIDFLKDSFVIALGQNNKNRSLILTPTEFYKIYEWSIIDIINAQIDGFPSLHVKSLYWRDFYRVCNSDLNIIPKSFINFALGKESLLPFDSHSGNFAKNRSDMVIQRSTTKIKNIDGEIVHHLPKFLYSPICEPGEFTGMLFLDNTATQYTQFDSDWPEIYQNYSGVSLWANYILENAGWLK